MPTPAYPRSPVAVGFASDRRYALIGLLEAVAAGRSVDDVKEVPSEISITTSGTRSGEGPPPLRHDVCVTFDHRLPLRSVYRALQREWPRLRRQGVVRATRPLNDRTLKLIRHVCIDMPQASWAERFETWNARHKRWRFSARQAFIGDFHRAERSFTGEPHGLAYWYSPLARLTLPELQELARTGDRSAKRERDRRKAAQLRTARRLFEKGDDDGKTRKR